MIRSTKSFLKEAVASRPVIEYEKELNKMVICKSISEYDICMDGMGMYPALIRKKDTGTVVSPNRIEFRKPAMLPGYLIDEIPRFDRFTNDVSFQFLSGKKWSELIEPVFRIEKFAWAVSGPDFMYTLSETGEWIDGVIYVISTLDVIKNRKIFNPADMGVRVCKMRDFVTSDHIDNIVINDCCDHGFLIIHVEEGQSSTSYIIDTEYGAIGQIDTSVVSISPDKRFCIGQSYHEDISDRENSIFEIIQRGKTIELKETRTLPKCYDILTGFIWLTSIDTNRLFANLMLVFTGLKVNIINASNGNFITVPNGHFTLVNEISNEQPFEEGLLLVKREDKTNPTYISFNTLLKYVSTLNGF
jgi:hypothetical protein